MQSDWWRFSFMSDKLQFVECGRQTEVCRTFIRSIFCTIDAELCGTVVRFLAVTFALLVLMTFSPSLAFAETMDVRISVLPATSPRARIEGSRSVATKAWSFRNVYGSLIGLGERIENLVLTDASGAVVQVRKLASGEYESLAEATRFSYEVKLDPPSLTTDAAYVSWVGESRGVLMLGDLLPRPAGNDDLLREARVMFDLPDGWKCFSSETSTREGEFRILDFDNSVFLIGTDLRARRERVGKVDFALVISGKWAFSDKDVIDMAVSILKDTAKSIGPTPRSETMLMLIPFPRTVSADRWSAETRGSNVLLLTGYSPSEVAGLAQLVIPLTHELFHLWVPNGLSLDGDYAWFYEGFTIYRALCTASRLELITFSDFLNAVAHANDAYLSAGNREGLSLIAASQRRWTGSSTLVYRKGMLVALLYDFALRYSSGGKRSLDDVYRALFSSGVDAKNRQDGNQLILQTLKAQGEMSEFTKRYVEDAGEVDLASAIAPYGLTAPRVGARTQISVSPNLNHRQRDLLTAFGYNERARRNEKRGS
jgi:hypothetical protein